MQCGYNIKRATVVLGKKLFQGQIIDYGVEEVNSKLLIKERVMYFSEEYFVNEN